jgi:hypothetical protein
MTIDGQILILNERQFFEVYRAANDLCSAVSNSYGRLQAVSTKYETGPVRTETTKSASFTFNKSGLRDFVAEVLRREYKPAQDNPADHLYEALNRYKRNWQKMSLFGSLDAAIDILTVEDQQTGAYYTFNYEINRTEFNCRIKAINYSKTKN